MLFISHIIVFLYASQGSRNSSNPWNIFQVSAVTWESLTRFSQECQETVFVMLPATNMGATLRAQIEMWPNQRAAGEARWLKRRHIGCDGDQCRQERKRRSVVSSSLLKISPAQLNTGVNAAVSSEMRWTVYVKIMQQIPAPSKCKNTSSALCLRPWSCGWLHAWKSPVNAGLFMHAQTFTRLGFYCASRAIYWMVQTAWTVARVFSGIVRKTKQNT